MAETAEKILGRVAISKEVVRDIKKKGGNLPLLGKILRSFTKSDTTDFLAAILYGAIFLDSSDVHFEPQADGVRIRFRLDGLLQDVSFFDLAAYQTLLPRLKLLSNIKLNITEKPQDGRFTVEAENLPIEIRASSLPSEKGESIVLRILNPKNLVSLEALGLRKDLYALLEKELKKPNGMIAVAGPTGSGKTTTLYAFLMKLQNPGIKIITIEDPIEYRLAGVSQTQIAPEKGYGFAEGLASIVRQDPDVILVGEIRDSNTAKIALQASLTGHLVLTTIHTNDASGTIPRLIDLETKASSVAPALKMAVGERLVRKVCQDCANLTKPSPEELAEIKKGLAHVPKEILPKSIGQVKIPRAKGCKNCGLTGYRGRKGLFEILLVNPPMEKLILANPPVSEIKKLAVKNGLITMYQSGLIEVVTGNTTLEEVKRVTGEEAQ